MSNNFLKPTYLDIDIEREQQQALKMSEDFEPTDFLVPQKGLFKAVGKLLPEKVKSKQLDPTKLGVEALKRQREFLRAPTKEIFKPHDSITEKAKSVLNQGVLALKGKTETPAREILWEAAGAVNPNLKNRLEKLYEKHKFLAKDFDLMDVFVPQRAISKGIQSILPDKLKSKQFDPITTLINETLELYDPIILAPSVINMAKKIKGTNKIAPELIQAYKDMGIKKDASLYDIKKLFKNKALKVHPDLPTGSIEEFQKLNNAYGVIRKEFPIIEKIQTSVPGLPKPQQNFIDDFVNLLKSEKGAVPIPKIIKGVSVKLPTGEQGFVESISKGMASVKIGKVLHKIPTSELQIIKKSKDLIVSEKGVIGETPQEKQKRLVKEKEISKIEEVEEIVIPEKIKIDPPVEKKDIISKSIGGLVKQKGGIDPTTLSSEELKVFKENKLGYLLKKDGSSIDAMAQSLVLNKEISIPENMNPSDVLNEALLTKQKTSIGKEIEIEKKQKIFLRSKEQQEIAEFEKHFTEKFMKPEIKKDMDLAKKQGYSQKDAEIIVKYSYGLPQYKKEFKKIVKRDNKIESLQAKLIKEKTKTELFKMRRKKVRAIRDYFKLTDTDLRKISRKDVRYMNEDQYKKFIEDMPLKAHTLSITRQKKNELLDLLSSREFEKVENIQKALNFPNINKMTDNQLETMIETLEPFIKGDEFLSVRKLETIDNTELKGVKTVREIKNSLAKKMGVLPDRLESVKSDFADLFKHDTALAQKNPFYRLMVEETIKAELRAEKKFQEVEDEFDYLLKKSRKSKKKKVLKEKIGQIFAPEDKSVFDWLDSDVSGKKQLQKKMTKEEMDLALYIHAKYAEMRDRLVEKKTLEKYRANYITHLQRGFLETAREDGLVEAFKEIFSQNEQQKAYFDIIDDTGNILPLEKFFRFSLQRTGGIKPTQNVAKAFLTYVRTFEKKDALDSLIPMIDAYTFSLQNRNIKTPRGIELDKSLKLFVNKWINTKKGRANRVLIEQGGKVDAVLKAANAMVTLIDLGLNIPVGLASQAGEQTSNWIMLGNKNYVKGLKRYTTSKGKKILRKYKNFIGRTLKEELKLSSKDLSEKLSLGIYGLFHSANIRGNGIYLLGSMSNEEFKIGEINEDRLAKLKIDMGRYRMVQNSTSVVGKSPEGKAFTKYKTWAIPILTQTLINLQKSNKMLSKGDIIKTWKSREFQELFRMSILGLTIYGLFAGDDEKNPSFLGKIKIKVIRELMSAISAMGPSMWTDFRLRSFISDIAKGIDQLIKLERYEVGNLKGVKTLTRKLTPYFLRSKIKKINGRKKKGISDIDIDFDIDLDIDFDI